MTIPGNTAGKSLSIPGPRQYLRKASLPKDKHCPLIPAFSLPTAILLSNSKLRTYNSSVPSALAHRALRSYPFMMSVLVTFIIRNA
jgi:hypothetical protein